MKNKLIILLSSLFFIACQEVIVIDDLKSITPKLVIQADIYWDKDSDVNNQPQEVILSLTKDFYASEKEFVNNATVVLKDDQNNTFATFINQGDGVYLASNFTEPAEGKVYELQVVYNNELYKGFHKYESITQVDFVDQQERAFFGGNDVTQLNINFENEAGVANSYFLKYEYIDLSPDKEGEENKPLKLLADFDEATDELITVYSVSNDDLISETPGANFVEDVFFFDDSPVVGQEFKITLYSISKTYENFMRQVLINVGESNGPSDTAPAVIKGNMFNESNEKNYPQGYFVMGQKTGFVYPIKASSKLK